ncbi:MAG: PAS domain-containing hybrid sensor histidine kinase/response regulator [Fusobacteriota bacterium]
MEMDLEKYKTIVNNIKDGILILDNSSIYKVLDFNKSLKEILGYNSNEIKNMNSKDFIFKNKGYNKTETLFDYIKKEISREVHVLIKNKENKEKHIGLKIDKFEFKEEKGIICIFHDITEKVKVREKIEESQKNFKNTFEQAAVGMVHTNLKGNIIRVNNKLCNMLGYNNDELLNKNFKDISYKEDLEEDIKKYEKLLKNKISTFNLEKRYKCKNGELLWCDLTVSKIKSKNHETYILGVIKDISEKKEAIEKLEDINEYLEDRVEERTAKLRNALLELRDKTEELNESKDRFEKAILNAPFPIMIHTEFGKVITINNIWEDITGYKKEEIKTMGDWITKAYKKNKMKIEKRISKIYTIDKKINEGVFSINTKSGEDRKWNFSSAPLGKSKDGERVYISIASDITEKTKTMEEKEKIFRLSQDIIVVSNKAGYFTFVNQAAEKILGYSKKELMNKPFFDLVIEEDKDLTRDVMSGLFEGNQVRDFQNRYKNKNGDIIWLSWNASTDEDRNRVYAVARDITRNKKYEERLKRAKEEAEAANKAKSAFLANMSHEIRTPLNSIVGFADLMEGIMVGKKEKKYLKSIKNSSDALLTIINDILDISKIEAGKMQVDKEPVNVSYLIKEVENIFIHKIKSKGLKFKIEIDNEVPDTLILDRAKVRQILFNLVGNAVKFTDMGYIKIILKQISKSSDRSNIDLKITVEDTGIGIEESSQEKIFESFTQQGPSITKEYGGTGLGLAITKKLVEMLNGKIELESKKGEGSKFNIILNEVGISATKGIKDFIDENRYDDIVFKSGSILIVDDIKENRELIKEIFSNPEFNIKLYEASDGEKAVEMAQKEEIDLILMDIKMPKLNGYEATRKIKDQDKDIKIIALTASTLKTKEKVEERKIFDGYIYKPARISDLYREVMKFLEYERDEIFISKDDTDDTEIITKEQKEVLENKIYEKWKIAIENKFSEDIKEFGEEVRKYGEEKKIETLKNYGTDILYNLDEFDLDTVEKLLEKYPSILEELEVEN